MAEHRSTEDRLGEFYTCYVTQIRPWKLPFSFRWAVEFTGPVDRTHTITHSVCGRDANKQSSEHFI